MRIDPNLDMSINVFDLHNIDFNINGKLSSTFYASYIANINRVTGEVTLSINTLIPANMIVAPTGTTHIKLFFAGAEIDFENETFSVNTTDLQELPYGNNTTSMSTLCQLPANSTHPLFAVLGVGFYQEVNGVKYPLKNGFFNCLNLVKVSGL